MNWSFAFTNSHSNSWTHLPSGQHRACVDLLIDCELDVAVDVLRGDRDPDPDPDPDPGPEPAQSANCCPMAFALRQECIAAAQARAHEAAAALSVYLVVPQLARCLDCGQPTSIRPGPDPEGPATIACRVCGHVLMVEPWENTADA